MTPGAIVWSVIGAAWVAWILLSAALPRPPGVVRLVRAFLGSWAVRVAALGAWAGAGWHLFCQRP